MVDDDRLVEIPDWVKRVRPNTPAVPRKRTLSDRLKEASGNDAGVIDLAELERDLDRLRSDD